MELTSTASVTVTAQLSGDEQFTTAIDRGRHNRRVVIDTISVHWPRGIVTGRGFKINPDGARSKRRVHVVEIRIEELDDSLRQCMYQHALAALRTTIITTIREEAPND